MSTPEVCVLVAGSPQPGKNPWIMETWKTLGKQHFLEIYPGKQVFWPNLTIKPGKKPGKLLFLDQNLINNAFYGQYLWTICCFSETQIIFNLRLITKCLHCHLWSQKYHHYRIMESPEWNWTEISLTNRITQSCYCCLGPHPK